MTPLHVLVPSNVQILELSNCIKPLPDGMVPHVFENGQETIIHTRNEKSMDDEKIEEKQDN